jgi:protein-tyrosine-phosphatase
MAAALLRRRLAQTQLNWTVESAGVVGHDGEPAQSEAHHAMAHIGLDIAEHRARSVTDELVAQAGMLVAIDSGTARVLRGRYPDAAPLVAALGELAGSPRDVPDPFRMQIGAWIAYARELDALLQAALPRMAVILGAAGEQASGGPPLEPVQPPLPPARVPPPAPQAALPQPRAAAVERIERLAGLAAEMPGVVDWPAARARIEADLTAAALPLSPADLITAYIALLRAALSLMATPPAAGQLAMLRDAAARMRAGIRPEDVAWLSALLAEPGA